MGGGGIGGDNSMTGSTYWDIALAPIALSYTAFMEASDFVSGIGDMMEGPELPEPAKPEAEVVEGDEGIRRGELAKRKRKLAMGEAFLTRGQERDSGAKLGGMAKTLG